MLNQLRAGLEVAPEERFGKPDELKKYEQMKALGIPVLAGGVQDQPHIWLEMVGVIENMLKIVALTQQSTSAQPKDGQDANRSI
jgi:hypothetical protein